jgi:endonuclease/exonuclease/phosphatase family metal-dependent hydrolase
LVYAALIVAVLAAIRFGGERFWPIAPLVYMPRWLFLPPLLVLALGAGHSRRRTLWLVHGISALVIAGPLMQLSVPIGRLSTRSPQGPRFRIMALNRGQRGIDAARLIRLIEQEQIQLICLQEGGGDPIMREYWRQGWYRTDFVASRFPVVSVQRHLTRDDPPDPSWRTRAECVRVRPASGVEFAVASVHLDTVRRGLTMLGAGDLAGFRQHSTWREDQVEQLVAALTQRKDLPALVGGDFNIPSDSPLFAPIQGHFRIAYEEAGWGYGYTYPTRLPWIRIDHLLASPHWTITRCWVGPDVGSDHLPLIAEVILSDPAQSRADR